MADPIIIQATKRNGQDVAYIGSTGSDGYVYFNDSDFYRFKTVGRWEDNLYILNRWRHSWTKCTMFTKLAIKGIDLSPFQGRYELESAYTWTTKQIALTNANDVIFLGRCSLPSYTAGATFGTLPNACRPNATIRVPLTTTSDISRNAVLFVLPSGELRVNTTYTSSVFFELKGLSVNVTS